jgi:hypothetical protein
MEANKKRNIKSGSQYDHLFLKAEGSTSTIRKNANVTHTVAFIPKVVGETLDQTKRLSRVLKGRTTHETCKNIWQFVYQHIAYKKDQEGFEQIRSPSRSWHDRRDGVDCDCYSVFISSILTNIGIAHLLRITKYHRDYFQHIYPVVTGSGKEIVLDCVTDQFDYEVPFSEKKDYPMDLQYLNGFEDDGISELGKLLSKKIAAGSKKPLPVKDDAKFPLKLGKKKGIPGIIQKVNAKAQAKASLPPAASTASKSAKPKKKGLLKKVLNKVNKVNPATVLLRNGILAAMKLNVKNVAKRLRWSYLTPEGAAKSGIDPAKFQRLVATRQKLEKIFYGAGGKEANLKKAILGGKGNKDKAVSGLSGINFSGVDYLDTSTALPQLLGPEIYFSENVEGFTGLGQLGEPVTLASVGAAMGVIAGIVAALKQIGDIFPKKTKGSEDFDEKVNEAAENNQPIPDTTPVPQTAPPIVTSSSASSLVNNDEAFVPNSSEAIAPAYSNAIVPNNEAPSLLAEDSTKAIVPISQTEQAPILPETISNETTVNTTSEKESIWIKYKWLKPVAIGVGGLGIVAIGYSLLKPKGFTRKVSSNKSLSGISYKKAKKKNHHRKQKLRHTKKKAVALL